MSTNGSGHAGSIVCLEGGIHLRRALLIQLPVQPELGFGAVLHHAEKIARGHAWRAHDRQRRDEKGERRPSPEQPVQRLPASRQPMPNWWGGGDRKEPSPAALTSQSDSSTVRMTTLATLFKKS